jgi:hypothetical protein
MNEFVRADLLNQKPKNCGNCQHRTAFLGLCVKKGEKVGQWAGPCHEYRAVIRDD